jgi:hypothetical protein
MSKIILKTSIAAVALLAAVPSAEAYMRVTATYGAWTASEGLDDGGTPMCLAALLGADRAFFVKAYSGNLVLHIFKAGWQIPENQSINVVLRVDRAPPINFVGYGLPRAATDTLGGFEIYIDAEAVWQHTGRKMISELVGLLMAGRELHLNFPDGTEQPWQGSLAGSTKILTEMMTCQRSPRHSGKANAALRGRPAGPRAGARARTLAAIRRRPAGPATRARSSKLGRWPFFATLTEAGSSTWCPRGPFRRPARVCCRAWRPARAGRPAPPQGILV